MEIAASKAAQGGDDLTAFERFPGIGVHASLVIKALRIGNPYRGRWSIFWCDVIGLHIHGRPVSYRERSHAMLRSLGVAGYRQIKFSVVKAAANFSTRQVVFR
jgi:hypothetical protein